MSQSADRQPPDSGGGERNLEEVATPASSVLRTPLQSRPSEDQPSVQNLFNNPNYSSASPLSTGRTELLKKMQDTSARDFLARKWRTREEQLAKHFQDETLPMFSSNSRVTITAQANTWRSNSVDYIQQCKVEIRVLFETDSSEIDMLNTIEKMLANLPTARKVASGLTDHSKENMDKVSNAFISMVEDITTYRVDPEDDLEAFQDSLQALYST